MGKIWARLRPEKEDEGEILDLSTGAFTLSVEPDQLRPITDPMRQRALFKRAVKRVVIESSSYCNRRCVFCPNSDESRLGARKLMPETTYTSIIDSLAEIDYGGSILFHLYNEPLANPEIFAQIAYARRMLPAARLGFNSNGDYIRPETLRKLAEAGLSHLHISIYGPDHGRFDRNYVLARVGEMAETCGFSRDLARWVASDECHAQSVYIDGTKQMSVSIQGRDFNIVGYDRGGLVNFDDQVPPERRYPCPSPFDEVLIGWNGIAVPCCNIVSDRPEHEPYAVGRVAENCSIFEIYANGPLVAWRQSLLSFKAHKEPCRQCTRLSFPVAELSEEHLAFNKVVDEFATQARQLAAATAVLTDRKASR